MVLCVATALAACGGDDNDSDPTPTPTATPTIPSTPTPTPEPDREPDAITFAPVTDATRNTEQTSAVVNITGIDPGTSLSIAGGEYQLGGSGGFVNTETTIDSGTSVQLRTNASANFSETVTVTLTVGTSNFDFVVTTEDQDITPADFSFTEQTNLPRNAAVAAAETITITEVNDTVSVSVQNGMYRINGGDFTADPGTAELSDEVEVAIMTSADFNTPITATLTIGTLSADFTGSTELDNEPDAFALVDQTDADRGEEFTQGPFTLTGIETDVELSINDGHSFSLDGTNFTSMPTFVSDGQELWIRGIASSEYGGFEEITVVAGITTSRFTITTFVDEQQPEVTIQFPPPSTMTEGENVLIRGVASDRSAITRLQINGLDAEDTSGDDEPAFSTWQLRVDLTLDQTNTLTVMAEDEAENINNVNSVNLLRVADVSTESFPDNNVPLSSAFYALIDEERDQLILLGRGTIFTIDLDSGTRQLIHQSRSLGASYRSITIDERGDFLYITDELIDSVFRADLNSDDISIENGTLEVIVNLSDELGFDVENLSRVLVNPLDNQELLLGFREGIIAYSLLSSEIRPVSTANTDLGPRPNSELEFIGFDFVGRENTNQLYVSTNFSEVLRINLEDGMRTELTVGGEDLRPDQVATDSNAFPWIVGGEAEFDGLSSHLAIDPSSDVLYLTRGVLNVDSDIGLIAVDLDSGARRVVSDNSPPNISDVDERFGKGALVFDPSKKILYWFGRSDQTVLALDPQNGERVVLSKSVSN